MVRDRILAFHPVPAGPKAKRFQRVRGMGVAVPANRPLVVSIGPEEGSRRSFASVDDSDFSDEQDVLERWIATAVLGGLILATSLLTLIPVIQGGSPPSGVSLVAGGALELFFGLFLVYVVFPSALWATALACLLTILDGIGLIVGGEGVAPLAGIGLFLAGVGLASLGTLRAVRTWRPIAGEL